MNETLFTTMCYKYCQDNGFEITKVGNTGNCLYCEYMSPLSRTAVASILYSIKDVKDSRTKVKDEEEAKIDEDCFLFTDKKNTFVCYIKSADYSVDCYAFLDSIILGFEDFMNDCKRKLNIKFDFFGIF